MKEDIKVEGKSQGFERKAKVIIQTKSILRRSAA